MVVFNIARDSGGHELSEWQATRNALAHTRCGEVDFVHGEPVQCMAGTPQDA